MFRVIHILFATCILVFPTLTKAEDIYKEITFDALWDLVQARDFEATEEMFAESHARTTQDPDDDGHTRWLFGLFGTNSPKIARFAQDWLEVYPESPFAHTAQTWVLYNTGWNIRGDGPGRKIYRDAHAEFKAMHQQALSHASFAYEKEPTLLPASDALLRLANSTHTQQHALQVLDDVMARNPNIGTLRRALDMSNPGWGGSWELAENMCEYYAPMAKNHSIPNPVRWCKLMTAGKFHANKLDWYRTEIAKGEYPALNDQRIQHIHFHKATMAEAAFIFEYLTDPDVIDYDVAYKFDSEIAGKFGYEFQYENHIRRARKQAQKNISRDPYNSYYLKTLSKDIDRFSLLEGGRKMMSVIERTPREDKREYARRLLQGSPYNPAYWRGYARYKFDASDPDHILLDEPYLINAVVYERHDAGSLWGFVFSRWQLLSQLERLEWEMSTPNWKEQSPEQLAESTEIIEGWIARRATLDLDAQIRCPMMRAYRLYQMVCGRPGQSACQMQTQIQEMAEIVKADVNERRACTGVMAAQESDLYFTPIQVDLSNSGG